MSDRILFNANFGELEWSGTTQKKASLPSSSLVIPDPLLEASNYYFDLDGTIYECTGVSDTASYLTFRYDLEGTNVLYVRLVKATDTVDISIRPASFPEVDFENSVLKIIEKEAPSGEGKAIALVRFNRWLAVKILYNNGYTYEVIRDGEIPSTERKIIKYAIIRLTKDLVLEIIYNETTGNVEVKEV